VVLFGIHGRYNNGTRGDQWVNPGTPWPIAGHGWTGRPMGGPNQSWVDATN